MSPRSRIYHIFALHLVKLGGHVAFLPTELMNKDTIEIWVLGMSVDGVKIKTAPTRSSLLQGLLLGDPFRVPC